ncbi:MAG: LytTR family DNA-binding domain-containing protein [Lachnospiraceae bacterium]|nr:LytTR family DNA-binding domain-containing protein [Lachnospiraceae bacterium]
MVQIAICDDEKEAVALHEEIIKDSLQSCGIGYEITTYTYSSNLLSDIVEDGFFYDLLLLDIEMPDVNGMELSKKIKPFLPNIKVIFITSHMEYAIDAFELSIFRYVPKNDLGKRLKTAVADAARLIELEAGKEYIIQAAGRMEKIPYRDIFYIQRDGGKNAAIYSNAGISKVRKSLQQVFEELDAPEFIFIDRGCIVNIIQIMKVADGMAFLKNGEVMPVSRAHLQVVKQQINRFWGTHI